MFTYCNYAFLESRVTLAPDGRVSVCPEENLDFTCTTNRTFIEWTVAIYDSTSESRISRSKLLSHTAQFDPVLNIIQANRTFNITRISSEPFISVLSVQSIAADLNGTTINCMDIGRSSIDESSSSVATIHVIRRQIGKFTIILSGSINQPLVKVVRLNIPLQLTLQVLKGRI